jgi:geranylgeranyl reductase family protein
MATIIGGGPVGCATAYLLAKDGQDATVYEEHRKIGEPVQCTGIVTSEFSKYAKVEDGFLVNRIRSARIFSPGGKHIEIGFSKPDLVIDRAKFDRRMAERAEDAGAKVIRGAKLEALSQKGASIRIRKKLVTAADNIIIGADGPLSRVAKEAGLSIGRKFLTGIQATVRMKNDNAVEFFPYIGTFGWVVPEDERTARVGLLGRGGNSQEFRRLLKLKGIKESQITAWQGGVVPIYDRRARTFAGPDTGGKRRPRIGRSIYLVGDAAGQVKSSTGGGIIPGLIAAKELADSILYDRDYEKSWRAKLGRELWLHSMIRRAMDRFTDDDWNRLVSICGRGANRRMLGCVNRDNLSRLALRMGIQEPRLWGFGKKLIW